MMVKVVILIVYWLIEDVHVLLASFEVLSLLLQLQYCVELVKRKEYTQNSNADAVRDVYYQVYNVNNLKW